MLTKAITFLSAGGIGTLVGGLTGFSLAGRSSGVSDEFSLVIKEDLKFVDELNSDQVDVARTLWKKKEHVDNLIDYFDYQAWVNKAKEYSLKKDKWPGDIIFIEDKSDKSLGEKLRNKCYQVAKWFFIGSQSENNEDVKNIMKNVHGNFSIDVTKSLCSSPNSEFNSKIKTIQKRSFMSGFVDYECKENASSSEGWINDIYALKKEWNSSSSLCDIVRESGILLEIEYQDGNKKYELLKSRKISSGFEAILGDGKIYDSGNEIPGFSDLFRLKTK